MLFVASLLVMKNMTWLRPGSMYRLPPYKRLSCKVVVVASVKIVFPGSAPPLGLVLHRNYICHLLVLKTIKSLRFISILSYLFVFFLFIVRELANLRLLVIET
jgi:hypothetical protein